MLFYIASLVVNVIVSLLSVVVTGAFFILALTAIVGYFLVKAFAGKSDAEVKNNVKQVQSVIESGAKKIQHNPSLVKLSEEIKKIEARCIPENNVDDTELYQSFAPFFSSSPRKSGKEESVGCDCSYQESPSVG